MKNKSDKRIFLILSGGALLRLVFLLFIAKYYFGRENIFYDHDTGTWANAIYNWFETGNYSVDLQREMGYFMRMPGYSFFMLPFWLIAGKDWWMAFKLIGWFQSFLDIANIWFIYKLSLKLIPGNIRLALIAATVYALYPFVIVWNPVAYSELIAVSLMLYAFWFLPDADKPRSLFFSGALMGLSVLFRPQIAPLIPLTLLSFWWFNFQASKIKTMFVPLLFFVIGVCVTYGLWPARNYLIHGKAVFTQNLSGLIQWNEDIMEFRHFIYSVKAEWEPQFSQILSNQAVTYPAPGLFNQKDSTELMHAFDLCKQCGIGFSSWRGYWKQPVNPDNDCSPEIAAIFRKLRLQQAKDNPLNYYLWVPLQNLKKAVFKFSLKDTSSPARKLASLLFILRTTLILCGLAGLFLMFKKGLHPGIARIYLLYFISLYLYLCFGTGEQCRNIEVRYFLPADVMLLLPASILFDFLWKKKVQSPNSLSTSNKT